jgi:hypothetical protein
MSGSSKFPKMIAMFDMARNKNNNGLLARTWLHLSWWHIMDNKLEKT